jgi:hypothetical protein
LKIGFQDISLSPGQFIFGRNEASKQLKMSVQTIRTCVDYLTKSENLTIKTTNKFSIFTVINWNTYQIEELQSNQQTNQPLTSKQPTTNQPLTTDKNVKNEENEKNEKKESKPLVPKLQFSFEAGRWENLNGQVERWSTAYPAVNVQLELNKAGAWLMANPKNRKSNYESFMVKWLTRSQDSARPEKQQPKTFTAMKQEELINTLNKLNGDDNDQTDFFGRFSQTTRRIENQPDGDRIGGIHGRVIAINR